MREDKKNFNLNKEQKILKREYLRGISYCEKK